MLILIADFKNQVTFLQSKIAPNNIFITLQTWFKSDLIKGSVAFIGPGFDISVPIQFK